MSSPKKADCTPEQWAAHLEAGRVYRAANRERERQRDRARYARDSENIKARVKAYSTTPTALEKRKQKQRLRISGVSPRMFADLIALQDGTCPICRRPLVEGPTTHADHCHDTKRPRGLLCNVCNTVEGLIKKLGVAPEDFGRRMQDYLDNPPADRLLV